MIFLTVAQNERPIRVYISAELIAWIREPLESEKENGINAIIGMSAGTVFTIAEGVTEIMQAIDVDKKEKMRSFH